MADTNEALTKEKVLQKLSKITYKESLADKKGLSIDHFASFLATDPKMPSNDELRKFFADDKVKEYKPTKMYDYFGIKRLTFDNNFIKDNLSEPFNNKFMFVGLNVAARPNKTGDILSNWQNFHDSEYNDNNITNTAKLYVQVNDPKFYGSYVTDAIKKVIESNSGNIEQDYFLSSNFDLSFGQADYDVYKGQASDSEKELVARKDQKRIKKYTGDDAGKDVQAKQQLQNNKEVFFQSADIFLAEMKAISPEHLLIFGKTAYHALQRMKDLDEFKKIAKYTNLIDDATVLKHYAGYDATFEKWFKDQPSAYSVFEEK